MAKTEPIPLIGVRGSDTAISATKVLIAGSAVMVASAVPPNQAFSPVDRALDKSKGGLDAAFAGMKANISESWKNGSGKVVAAVGVGLLVFGKKIDKRMRDFPIKFGR